MKVEDVARQDEVELLGVRSPGELGEVREYASERGGGDVAREGDGGGAAGRGDEVFPLLFEVEVRDDDEHVSLRLGE